MTYPPIEPFDAGLLGVAGNEIYWEVSGNPDGKPALYLHGGPGSALGSGGYRRHFDPQKYRIVGIDQRGCGESRPLATDVLGELHRNTTQSLIEDIEAWLVSGVSWGTTLALAYAQAHPERVSELVLVAVTTTSREEIDWITEGVGRIFPEAWQRFEQASGRRASERVVEAYARRLATGDMQDRLRAARAWNDWEWTHISLDPNWASINPRFDEKRGLVFATLVTHYWSNDGFLQNGKEILCRVSAIGHIPAVLIRTDIIADLFIVVPAKERVKTQRWQQTQLSWPDLIGPSRATDNNFNALSGWPGLSPAMTMGTVETFGAWYHSWPPRHQRASDNGLAPPPAVASKPLAHRGSRRAWRAAVDGTDAHRT